MVEISEIVDRESLKAWLKTRPDKDAVVIAHRAAQRVLPVVWHGHTRKRELTPFPFLRCNLTSGEVCYAGSPEVKAANAAIAAANAAAYAANAANAAANAANAAANAAAYAANAANAAAYTANAAANVVAYAADAAAILWNAIRQDAVSLTAGQNLSAVPLWADDDNPLQTLWDDLVPELRTQFTGSEQSVRAEEGIDYSFWIDWYERALTGTEARWDMIATIALIRDDVWQGEPADLMRSINLIWRKYDPPSAAPVDTDKFDPIVVFRATLFDFTYDGVEAVMRAIPLEQDWKHLTNPDLLSVFLGDADELVEDLELFCDALSSEGTAMQGAGIVRTYCGAILKELTRAKDVGTLRVAKLIEYARMIETARLDPETQKEFGLLAPALQSNGEALLNLMRNHFARTIGRFAELREIGIEDDASHWEVLQGFRDLISKVKAGGEDRPALASDDAEVLSDILESVDRQMRALDAAQDEGSIASWKRDINFELAKLGATIEIYRERAVDAEADAAKVADITLKWEKRGLGLMGVLTRLKDLL